MSDFLQHWRELASRLLDGSSVPRRWLMAAAAGALVIVCAGVVVARAQTRPVELTLPRAVAATDSVPDAAPLAPGPEESGAPVAHAAGAVAHPGVYTLTVGARVADLLAAAGGPTADADLDAINLATKVADGDRIYVPRRGEVAAPVAAASAGGAPAGAPAVVNLNTATLADLDSLPGVGPATAQAILDYRREHGRFRSVDQLLEVRGIGEAKLRQIRPRVRV